jgi:hypothetical protein
MAESHYFLARKPRTIENRSPKDAYAPHLREQGPCFALPVKQSKTVVIVKDAWKLDQPGMKGRRVVYCNPQIAGVGSSLHLSAAGDFFLLSGAGPELIRVLHIQKSLHRFGLAWV